MAPYKVLPSESFRLLRLAPGEEIDDIEAFLEVHGLHSQPDYESISYAWGSPDRTARILLNNYEFPVTSQVQAALVRMRYPRTPRLVWIDAICINQADTIERESQVLQMSLIYTNAKCVLCYLGEDVGDDDSSVAFTLIQKVGAADFSRLRGLAITDDVMQTLGIPPPEDLAWLQFWQLFERPWFRRAWVVQEFICGSECLFICGNAQATWKALHPGLEIITEYGLLSWGVGLNAASDASQNAQIITASRNANDSLAALRYMLEIKSARKISDSYTSVVRSFVRRDETAQEELIVGSWDKTVPGTKLLVDMLREDFETADFVLEVMQSLVESMFSAMGIEDKLFVRFPFLQVQRIFHKTLATDPRDKLFSILSLSEEYEIADLRPSYTEPVELVFTRYAKFFLVNQKDPVFNDTMLVQAGWRRATRPSAPGTATLPSWVPDFAASLPDECALQALNVSSGLRFGSRAGGSTLWRARFDDYGPHVLRVCGSQVGTITRILPNITDAVLECETITDTPPDLALVNHLDQLDMLFLLRDGEYRWRKKGETNTEVLWRTLVANSGERPFIPGPEYHEYYAKFRENVERMRCGAIEQQDATDAMLALLQSPWAKRWWYLTMNDMMVCETDSGLLGLVPRCTRVGDKVVVLNGSTMPFVFRGAMAASQGKYESLGACYMHGIMHGEAVLADIWKEEEFRII